MAICWSRPWIVGSYFKGEGWLDQGRQRAGLVPHGRRGHHRCRWLHADHRPQQGRDQVRRRVDQLHRHREHRHGAPCRGQMAACVGMPHPNGTSAPSWRWSSPGAEVTREELLRSTKGKTGQVADPDDVVFVDAIPLGATGKMLKTRCASSSATTSCPACDGRNACAWTGLFERRSVACAIATRANPEQSGHCWNGPLQGCVDSQGDKSMKFAIKKP